MTDTRVFLDPANPSAILRLVQPVGREAELERLHAAFTDASPDPRVVGVTGPGGIGKTYILDSALRQARESGARVADRLVDLYHTHTHTADGLSSAIRQALPDADTAFAEYDARHKELQRMRVSGVSSRQVGAIQAEVLEMFVAGMQRYSQAERVALALDTAERLAYGAGLSQEQADETEVPEGWLWLKKALPRLGRVTLVIAGRPAVGSLFEQLKQALPPESVDVITLGALSSDATSEYFDEAAQLCRANGDRERAEAIEKVTAEYRRQVHQHTDGNPILLALLLEYVVTTVGAAILETPADASGDGKADLECGLVRHLTEEVEPRHVIQYLGYLPKGADANLLARVMNVPEPDAQAALDGVKKWSVVKVRAEDGRVFLHDEMYRLVPKHAPLSDAELKALGNRHVPQDYNDMLLKLRNDNDALFRRLERKDSDDQTLRSLAAVLSERQNLLTEIVAYRLREDPVKGYQRYYRYNHEAILAYDVTLNAQLEAELRAFLTDENAKGQASALSDDVRAQMQGTLAMQPVVRAWTAENYAGLVDKAAELRARHPGIFTSGSQNEAELDTWVAASKVHRGKGGDHAEAEESLNRVIALLTGREEREVWRSQFILMTAYWLRGYLRRLQGKMRAAIKDYRDSLRLARQLNVLIQAAQSLNDMGFALAAAGEFKEGRSLVEDAEAIRRHLMRPAPAGLSLNTLAHIHLWSGEYDEARLLSERALRLFTALGHQRGEGMARRTHSEAIRRQADAAHEINTPAEWMAALQHALSEAEEAYAIAADMRELSREVEALTEAGCCYRNMVKVAQAQEGIVPDVDTLVEAGAGRLRQAANRATAPYQQVDALVDLAWLGVYAERLDLIEEAERRITEIVPKEYYLDKKNGRPVIDKEEAEVELWPQLGKLYALHGHQAFEEFRRTRDRASLQRAGQEYALALQYTGLFSDDFAGMRRAKDEIYEHVKRLNERELLDVASGVILVEQEYNLGTSTMREFLDHRALWYGE